MTLCNSYFNAVNGWSAMRSRASYYLTCLLFEHCKKHCEDVKSQNLYRYFNAVNGWSATRSRVSYYLTCLLFEHCKKHCEDVKSQNLYRYFNAVNGWSATRSRLTVEAICLVFIGQNLAIIYLVCYNIFVIKILWYIASI